MDQLGDILSQKEVIFDPTWTQGCVKKFKMILKSDLFRANKEWLFEKLGLYLESMESAIDSVRQEDRDWIRQIEITSADDIDDQQEHLHLHALLFEEDFPSKLRYSFILLSYMLFESRCKELAKELSNRGQAGGLTLKKDSGESFPQAVRRFLRCLPKPLITVNESIWFEFDEINNLRNCIVHVNGDVEAFSQREAIVEIIKKKTGQGLTLNERGFVQIDHAYCIHVVEVVKSFFDQILDDAGFGPAQEVIR
jgi:hypothetical protein